MCEDLIPLANKGRMLFPNVISTSLSLDGIQKGKLHHLAVYVQEPDDNKLCKIIIEGVYLADIGCEHTFRLEWKLTELKAKELFSKVFFRRVNR